MNSNITIVHSFRNPLNVIRGAITFIKEEYSGVGNILDFTNIIEDEITRLENLISRLLASSFTINRKSTDINELIRSIEKATSLQAISRGIRTTYEYNKLPRIRIDSFQMEQAIRNIINNAIEAMPEGGKLIVRTGMETDYIFIEISDTGLGIRRLFLPGGSPGNNGRGLGLYIARQILNIHGGKLLINKKEDRGTNVKMLLPVREKISCKKRKAY